MRYPLVFLVITLLSGCVQLPPGGIPCPESAAKCPVNIAITTNIMASVPVSALPGLP